MISNNLFSKFGTIIKNTSNASIDSISSDSAYKLLEEYGIVLFRNFNIETEDFIRTTDRLMGKILSHGANTREAITADRTVVEVVKGNLGMCLHKELGYTPWGPELLWFHCLTPAKENGQTTICDGVELARSLSSSTRNLFEKNKIKYSHHWPPETWQGFLRTQNYLEAINKIGQYTQVDLEKSSHDKIFFNYEISAFEQTIQGPAFLNSILNMVDSKHLNICTLSFANGELIDDEIIDEIREKGEALSEKIEWKSGDLAMIDNRRMLHGRKSFSGERKIHTRFGMKLTHL
jgi:alpha-ketoglutarate-dependent taurine dioxygenase